MFVLTITLTSTNHQIVLGYKTLESAVMAREAIALKGITEVKDDYGTTAEFMGDDVAFVTVQNVAQRLSMENERGLMQLKADTDFQYELQQDPTTKFLVGSKNPLFDKR